jgi:hypothetical protein
MMNITETIINKFGTQKQLAEALGIRQSNVSYWSKTGSIPAKWHSKIIECAGNLGIAISASDFINAPAIEGYEPAVKPVSGLRILKEAELDIAGVKVPCAVLSNGKRIFFQREIVGLLTGNKKGGFSRYLQAGNLQPFIPEKFKGRLIEDVVHVFLYHGQIAQGFEATDLIEICEMYLKARAAKYPDGKPVLIATQQELATKAEIITRAFAKIGVIAAIDEATGWQMEESEYQRLLSQYIADLQPWLTTFGDNYYEQIYRLKGWDWSRYIVENKNHPWAVANITNRVVYEKLPVGVLEKLRDLCPRNEKGNRKHKLYKHLASPGYVHLVKHLGHVEAIMEQNKDWISALKQIDARFPSLRDPYGQPLLMLSSNALQTK